MTEVRARAYCRVSIGRVSHDEDAARPVNSTRDYAFHRQMIRATRAADEMARRNAEFRADMASNITPHLTPNTEIDAKSMANA